MGEISLFFTLQKMAERAGFEPAVLNKEHTGFRNRLDQPLRHLSVTAFLSYTLKKLELQEHKAQSNYMHWKNGELWNII
jgi:hypothetical protein